MFHRVSVQTVLLTLLFSCSFSACGMKTAFTPDRPQSSLPILEKPQMDFITPETAVHEYADVLRDNTDPLLSDPALTAVTRDYGKTTFSAALFPLITPVKIPIAVAKTKAWSSWWYPKVSRFMFDENNGPNSSTLGKYDLLRRARSGRPSNATLYESKSYNPAALSWEGLCDAWAFASLMSPEPKHPVAISEGRGSAAVSVTFSIADLKALLLKTYEAVDDSSVKYYGQKFTGDVDGWIYPDLFPEQFHRFLEVQLTQKKEAFVMDHDPGIEVWNVPVYKWNSLISAVPNNPNAVFVRAWLYSAESVNANEKEFVGTREAIREYDYILEGTRNAAGDLVIDSGYWVKGADGVDSRKNHPDYVIQLSSQNKMVRKSWNPDIDIALVDDILSRSY